MFVRCLLALATAALFATARSGGTARAEPATGVELLRFPFPYRAAVTVSSDADRATVEGFESVHTLINTEAWIPRDSPRWGLLFADPAIDGRPEWREGMRGFGLPIADSIFLYHRNIGLYSHFDEARGRAVPARSEDGRDHRDIVEDWIRRGWLDTLHTGGSGDISRQAMARGLEWFQADPNRRLTVWVNHSIESTPSCIEPDYHDGLALISKNVARFALRPVAGGPGEALGRERSLAIQPLPRDQRLLFWTLSIALGTALAWTATQLLVARFRTGARLIGGILVIGGAVVTLALVPVRYAQGDNPGSRYYNLDLVRQAGFRYFKPIGKRGGTHEGRLSVPDRSWKGRRSFLGVTGVDDGSEIIVFPRSAKGRGGYRSLELLTDAALDALEERGEAAILYTHWIVGAHRVFTASGLDGLARLRDRFRAGRIWVAPASRLLHHEFVRTFLRYEARVEDGVVVVAIERVDGPTGDGFVPTLDDLAGISFVLTPVRPFELRLAGAPVPKQQLRVTDRPPSRIVQFPLPQATSEAAAGW